LDFYLGGIYQEYNEDPQVSLFNYSFFNLVYLILFVVPGTSCSDLCKNKYLSHLTRSAGDLFRWNWLIWIFGFPTPALKFIFKIHSGKNSSCKQTIIKWKVY